MFVTVITPASDLAKPSKEQLALQMELQRLQSARKLDADEFDNQKQVLQAQLQSEVSHVTAAEHEKVCGHLQHPPPTHPTCDFNPPRSPAPPDAAERSAQHRADGEQGEAAVADQAPGGHQVAAPPNSTRYPVTPPHFPPYPYFLHRMPP